MKILSFLFFYHDIYTYVSDSESRAVKMCIYIKAIYILSRASEVGSPTNHPGSRQRQDTGPGILWSVIATYKNLKKKEERTVH